MKLKEKILKILKNPRVITGITLGLLIGFFFFNRANADFLGIGGTIQKGVYTLLYWISSAIAWVGAQIIILEAKVLTWVLDNSRFISMPVVQTGWRICRDLANVFYIFILVYIAFCYIFRTQSRSTKQLIVNVIIMAILINFSLMIGGVIIDFSNVFFRFFVFGGLQPQPGEKVTTTLANALKLQSLVDQSKIATPSPSTSTATTTPEMEKWVENQMSAEESKTIIIGFGKLIFTIVMTFLMVIVFGALVGILFVRLFWLWILLIFAPLAWTVNLIKIKGTPSDLASEWWDKFLKWSFVAPVMGMFIYLALETSKQVENLNMASLSTPASKTMYDIQSAMQMFLVAGFLIAGLIAGQAMGAKLAGSALNLAKSAGDKTKGAIKKRGALLAARAGGAVGAWAGGGIAEGLSKSSKGVRTVAGVLGIGALSRSMARKGEEAKQKWWKEKTQKYENVSTDLLHKMKDSALMRSEKAAMYSVLAKRGALKEQDVDKALPLLSKYDKEAYEKTIKEHPDWHPDVRAAAKTGDVQQVMQTFEVKNIDSSKLNLAKISDPVIAEAAIKFKIQADPDEAARSLRNLKLDILNKYSSQIKEEFDKLDERTKQDFLKNLQSGFHGRIWAANNLLQEEPRITLTDRRGNPSR